MYFYLIHFRSKTTFTMSMYTKIKFSGTDNGKPEPDLDPKPEKLSEHASRGEL